MAQAEYKYKTVKHGIRCTGKITLSCQHKLEEVVIGRTQDLAFKACKRLLQERTEYHTKHDCDRG